MNLKSNAGRPPEVPRYVREPTPHRFPNLLVQRLLLYRIMKATLSD